MPVVDQKKAVTQMAELGWGLLRGDALVLKAQQLQHFGMCGTQGAGIAYRDLDRVMVGTSQQALEFGQARCGVELQLGQVFVVNVNPAAGQGQQPIDGNLIIAPGGNQFARHGT